MPTATVGGVRLGRLLNTHRVAVQVLCFQIAIIALLSVASIVAIWHGASLAANEQAVASALATTAAVADDAYVRRAITSPNAPLELRDYIARIRTDTGMRFITIADAHGIRLAHPDWSKVGQPFIGNAATALRGDIVVERLVGTFGPLVQVNRPIRNDTGRVIGMVSAGLAERSVTEAAMKDSWGQLAATVLATLLAIGFSLLVGRRLNRQTHGMGAQEIGRIWAHHQALLASVDQGLILFDGQGSILLMNPAARRLLGLQAPADQASRTETEPLGLADLGLDEDLGALLRSGRPCEGQIFVIGPRVVMVHQAPANHGGGWATTIQDRTVLANVTHSLDAERAFTEALRSRMHDADNRLHTVVSLIELGETERAAEMVFSSLRSSQGAIDYITSSVSDPALAALLVSKTTTARERGIELRLQTHAPVAELHLPAEEVVTVVGNLLDNAIEAAERGEEPRWVSIEALVDDGFLEVLVADSGPGVPAEHSRDVFNRGWTTKSQDASGVVGHGLGLALARVATSRMGGELWVEETRDDNGGTKLGLFRVTVPLPQLAEAR